eukprot:237722_1
MINGIFDDSNPSTVSNWVYPDTKIWDPNRNTNEFIGNMSLWYKNGLLSFTIGLQGGCPICTGNQPWLVSAFNYITGELNTNWTNRLSAILYNANNIGMIPIIQFFYPVQVGHFNKNNSVIYLCINNILNWLTKEMNINNYNNIIVDIANECDLNGYDG